jgi:fatty acid desaturase
LLINAGVPLLAPTYFLLYGSVGLTLLIHNLDARRAHILRGVLPWLGMVTAVFFLLAGIGYAIFLFGGPFAIGWNSLQLGVLLYIVWAIWMGIHLIRSKAPAPAISAPAAS